MRGLAAFMVFLFHFVLGFLPQRHGQEAAVAIPGGNLLETPLFFLINGHAAVTFFFVLSGFVLSYSYFSKNSNDGLLGSIIKRWPRLFPMALISTLFSWLMIHYGLYAYAETAGRNQIRVEGGQICEFAWRFFECNVFRCVHARFFLLLFQRGF